MEDIFPVYFYPVQQRRGVASGSYCNNGFQPVAGKNEKKDPFEMSHACRTLSLHRTKVRCYKIKTEPMALPYDKLRK